MDTASGNRLGDFLRASRGRLDPADAGIAGTGSRRVPGLRREEVAVLAGVSVDYYARLEQGRERNPSSQVLDGIARALRLDADERGHAYRLAGIDAGRSEAGPRGTVHPALLELLDSFPQSAGYVLGPSFDILATNALAAALLSPFQDVASSNGSLNMVRVLFLHPDARTVFVEWELVARSTVHALRLNSGLYPDDGGILAVVRELGDNAEFRALWEAQLAGGLTRAYKVFVHPRVGRIELIYQTFDVRDAPGQQLLVGTPAAGPSADAAALLR